MLGNRALQPLLRVLAGAHRGVGGGHHKRCPGYSAFSSQVCEPGEGDFMETRPFRNKYLYGKHDVGVVDETGRAKLGHRAGTIAQSDLGSSRY